MDELTKEQAYTAIIEWLYLNDKVYPEKMNWREAFVKHVKETINKIK